MTPVAITRNTGGHITTAPGHVTEVRRIVFDTDHAVFDLTRGGRRGPRNLRTSPADLSERLELALVVPVFSPAGVTCRLK